MGAVVELAISAALVATSGHLVILGPGALAPADLGVLEQVQETRLRYGFGLSEAAPEGTVLIGVQDCAYLGRTGHMLVSGVGWLDIAVVDCEADVHRGQMAARGLLADVSDARLAHRRAKIWLQ